jgi:hypothetical protein
LRRAQRKGRGADLLVYRRRPSPRHYLWEIDQTAGSSYWHVVNKDGLFAVPSEQLKLVEYQHCPWYQIRGIKLEG